VAASRIRRSPAVAADAAVQSDAASRSGRSLSGGWDSVDAHCSTNLRQITRIYMQATDTTATTPQPAVAGPTVAIKQGRNGYAVAARHCESAFEVWLSVIVLMRWPRSAGKLPAGRQAFRLRSLESRA